MSILILLSAIIILAYLIFILCYKELVTLITEMGNCCRKFIIENTGFFTILFLSIFFLEQVLLIIVVFYFFEVPPTLQIVISIFALIVVTTATLQKFVWEYKFQQRSKDIHVYAQKNRELIEDVHELIDENEGLKRMLEKKR